MSARVYVLFVLNGFFFNLLPILLSNVKVVLPPFRKNSVFSKHFDLLSSQPQLFISPALGP